MEDDMKEEMRQYYEVDGLIIAEIAYKLTTSPRTVHRIAVENNWQRPSGYNPKRARVNVARPKKERAKRIKDTEALKGFWFNDIQLKTRKLEKLKVQTA